MIQSTDDKIILEPGFYPDMPFDDYLKVDALNASTLLWGVEPNTAKHLKAAIDGRYGSDDTDALRFGRMLHDRVEDPGLFARKYHEAGQCCAIIQSKTSKRGGELCRRDGVAVSDTGSWFCKGHMGGHDAVEVDDRISPTEAMRIEACAQALKHHKADKLRKYPGEYEVVAVADLHGVRVKCRLDKLIRKPATIADFKKVCARTKPGAYGGIDLRKFNRSLPASGSMSAYGYGFRAGFYCDIVRELIGDSPAFYWILVEDNTPYDVAVVKASDADLNAGRNEYLRVLDMLKHCQETGVWPGAADGTVQSEGPRWWRKENGVDPMEERDIAPVF